MFSMYSILLDKDSGKAERYMEMFFTCIDRDGIVAKNLTQIKLWLIKKKDT